LFSETHEEFVDRGNEVEQVPEPEDNLHRLDLDEGEVEEHCKAVIAKDHTVCFPKQQFSKGLFIFSLLFFEWEIFFKF